MLNVVTCRFDEGRRKNGEISGINANDDDDDDDGRRATGYDDDDTDVSENRTERRACLGSLGCKPPCAADVPKVRPRSSRVVNHFPYIAGKQKQTVDAIRVKRGYARRLFIFRGIYRNSCLTESTSLRHRKMPIRFD